jgi:hypothetical protein
MLEECGNAWGDGTSATPNRLTTEKLTMISEFHQNT